MIQKIVKHTFFYSFANQVPAIVNLVLLPFLTPFLTSRDYAIYGLILAYVGLVGAFSSLGYIVLFQNSFFHLGNEFKQKWARLLGFQWIYKILYCLLVVSLLLILLQAQFTNSEELWLTISLVIIPLLFFDLTKSIGIRLCQYRNEHKKVYTISIFSALIGSVTTLLGILIFNLGFKAWLISAAISGGIQAIYFGYILYFKEKIKPQFLFDLIEIKSDLKTALPLVPKEYATFILSSSDRVLLNQFQVPINQIGHYNIAYSFASYFDNVQIQANQVITPILFRFFKEESDNANQLIKRLTHVWFYFSIGIATFLALWIPEFFPFLYRNPELQGSSPLAVILIFAFCYRPLYVAAVDRSIYYKNTMPILWITVLSAILNVIINLIFIPQFGVFSSAIATVLCYTILPLLAFAILKENRVFIREINPVILSAITGVLGAFCYLIIEIETLYRVGLTAVLFALFIAVYQFKIKKLIKILQSE
jgi:O-antigen/teichoic acid export membrane protein